MKYITGISAAISQLGNAFLGGNPNRTISARCYLNKDKVFWKQTYYFVNFIFFWQEDHCRDSHIQDIVFSTRLLGIGGEKNENGQESI